MNVVFLRGLNTFGDEQFRLGPWSLGRIDKFWRAKLIQSGHAFYAMDGMGPGDVSMQTHRAATAFRQLRLQKPGHRFHFLGYSQGGLVARALVHEPDIASHVLSVTTLGTPHLGSRLAEKLGRFHTDHPIAHQVLRHFGYDTQIRSDGG